MLPSGRKRAYDERLPLKEPLVVLSLEQSILKRFSQEGHLIVSWILFEACIVQSSAIKYIPQEVSDTMAEQGDRMAHFMARGNQPLIGVFRQEKGREIVQYFSDEAEADEASSLRGIREALSLAGAWSDLNWDEVEKELYRIRHESQPTPPISL